MSCTVVFWGALIGGIVIGAAMGSAIVMAVLEK